jgi:hypothetical protein
MARKSKRSGGIIGGVIGTSWGIVKGSKGKGKDKKGKKKW